MGNWRDRSRRNFRRQKTPWSVVRNYNNEPPLESWKDGIPLWEKKFCSETGHVPWRKIVDSKKFIYHHTNVLDWDDCACEEAFHNAKRRFWAEINGHQCDIYPPDPDVYIDRIDWNPKIDSKLIEEVDQAYFAPESEQSDILLECRNKKSRNSNSVSPKGQDEDRDHVDNPWEHRTKCAETKQLQWNWNCSDSGKVNNDGNPWDSSLTPQENRGYPDIFRGDNRSKLWDLENRESHFDGFQAWGKGWKNKGLGSDARNPTWDWNQQGGSNFNHYNKPRENSYNRNGRMPNDRIRPHPHWNEEDWKHEYSYSKRPKDAEFERTGRWGSRNHGAEMREGDVSRQRYSRPQREGYQINGSWRR